MVNIDNFNDTSIEYRGLVPDRFCSDDDYKEIKKFMIQEVSMVDIPPNQHTTFELYDKRTEYKEKLETLSIKELKIEALICETPWKRILIREEVQERD